MQENWLRKQRSLYDNLISQTPVLATHPISGEWQESNYLTNRYWWGGGASQEAFAQLDLINLEKLNQIGVISFGPIQAFLGSGQRLRDWAVASWLCHYLTAVLIFKWEEQGGKILLPLHQHTALIRWLKGENDIDGEDFWRPELPNVVTGLFPENNQWLETTQQVITNEWTRLVNVLEKKAIRYNQRLNGIGWRIIHRDNKYIWSVYKSNKPLEINNLIVDIHSLHLSIESQKIGRVWEQPWWGGYTSPSAGNLSIWHPGLKSVTDNQGGTWGLPRNTLSQWWQDLAQEKHNRLFSESDRLNSRELVKRLASIPQIIEKTLQELWNRQPPPCPWKNFPEETAIAAAWIKDQVTPNKWNQEIEFLNQYFTANYNPNEPPQPNDPLETWGMPQVDQQTPPYLHPRGLERRNVAPEQITDWQEYTQDLTNWKSTIEWRVGWRGDGDKLGEWLAGKQYSRQNLVSVEG